MSLARRRAGAALAAFLVTAAPAAQAFELMFGEPEARHATLTFSPDTSGAEAIAVATRRVGAPGSRLTLSIDRSRAPLVDRILSDTDCRFDDKGSMCTFAIPGGTPEYDRIVEAFRLGRTLHIAITNAGSMEMAEDVSLIGFTKAYEAL
jgi:hypothetical protein